MALALTNDSKDEKTQPSLSSQDHQHVDQEEMMGGHHTESNKVYEEMEDMLIPGQDLNFGIEPELDTSHKSHTSVESAGGKDEPQDEGVEIGKTTSVNSQTEVKGLDGTGFTSKDHEEPKEQEHVLKCEDEEQGDEEQREGESALTLTKGSPELLRSQPEASQSHEPEAHVDVTASTLEDGEASKETVIHVLREQCLPLSANDLLIVDRESGQLSSECHKSEQEARDEVLDPSMSRRDT